MPWVGKSVTATTAIALKSALAYCVGIEGQHGLVIFAELGVGDSVGAYDISGASANSGPTRRNMTQRPAPLHHLPVSGIHAEIAARQVTGFPLTPQWQTSASTQTGQSV
jgi:hypothetical protein